MNAPKMAASESTPTFKDLIKKTREISIRSGGSNGPVKSLGGEESGGSVNGGKAELSRFSMVKRKKDFKSIEGVNGRFSLKGLEFHSAGFRRWRGNDNSESGHIQSQGNGCEAKDESPYNLAVATIMPQHGNAPGIIRDEEIDPIPPIMRKSTLFLPS